MCEEAEDEKTHTHTGKCLNIHKEALNRYRSNQCLVVYRRQEINTTDSTLFNGFFFYIILIIDHVNYYLVNEQMSK